MRCLADSSVSSEPKDEATKSNKKSPTDRKVVNTYEHNPVGLMQFFDHPKNWNEQDVKTGKD